MDKLPQILKDDIEAYALDLKSYLAGELNPQKFKALRVPRGIYGQRKEKLFMVRVRIVGAKIYLTQVEKLARIAKKYGSDILHVTTRQDIQIHNVKIEDTVKVMRELAEVELSPRGGGGNTVRNILSCALSGICPNETFDAHPHVRALTKYLLPNFRNYNLPRKFKIVFDSCFRNCSLGLVNDVGFTAVVRDGARGFKVLCGGGMGMGPRIGFILEEFIPERDIFYVTEALIRVFDKFADRKNRHKARLRFLVEKIGEAEFRKKYNEELQQVKKESLSLPEIELDSKNFLPFAGRAREGDAKLHKDGNYYYISVRLELGDISAEKLESLVALLKKSGKDHLRTTHFQNMVIPFVKEDELTDLCRSLEKLGLAWSGAEKIKDIVSCTGALMCNLGICNSRGLAGALSRMLDKEGLGGLDLNIKVSGCPNSCGHHPIGQISFCGASRKSENHSAPFYRVFLGGRTCVQKTALAKDCGLVPAKNVPGLLRDFLKEYLLKKDSGEDFYAYLDRYGYSDMSARAAAYERLPSFSEDKNYYFDWGREEEFSLAGIGPGECGAGVLDMIEADLSDAAGALSKANELLGKEQAGLVSVELYKVLSNSSRALLVVLGLEPKNDLESFKYFKEKFVSQKIVGQEFSDITEKAWELKGGDLSVAELKKSYDYSLSLLKSVRGAYKNMDSSFKFTVLENKKEANPQTENLILDLKGVKCPMNYVKAKLYLENMDTGKILDIYLDEGEPVRNVPLSLKNDGQEIIEVKNLGGYYLVKVKKLV